MNLKVVTVILSGGEGKRMWPLSSSIRPKQFIDLNNNNSLFNSTLLRIQSLKKSGFTIESNYVVTNEEYRFLVLDQTDKLKSIKTQILLEPIAKNTAPAVTLAALAAVKDNPESIMIVMPSDHLVTNNKLFVRVMKTAAIEAGKNSIVTLGITPLKNKTGFGYIQFKKTTKPIKEVINFVEKPDRKKANIFLKSRSYLWNSGIFIFKASVWLDSLRKSRLDILKSTEKAFESYALDGKFVRFNSKLFEKIPSESVDYAVLENAIDLNIPVKVIKMDAGWDDLGSWEAFSKIYKQDSSGNRINGNVFVEASHNNIIFSDNKLIATLGVDDLLIAHTSDAILVAKKDNLENIKSFVGNLSKKKKVSFNKYSKVYRPWGWYETILDAEFFKVKRIHVKPNESLSLQKHKFRSEHWVVIEGEASIQLNNKSIKMLGGIAHLLEVQPDLSFMIEGHTDNKSFQGDNNDNWTLSVNRAAAVAKRS